MDPKWETVGSIDRLIRIGAGLLFLITGLLIIQSILPLAIILVVVGAVLTISGSTGFCPLYSAIGFNTLDEDSRVVYPSWRYHTESDRSRYNRYPGRKRYFDQSGSRYRTGITREWSWSQKRGLELHSRGVYRPGHTRR